MNESCYETTDRPFLPAPLVSRYFPASAIEAARKRMTTCISRADGPALLIGPAGTGKSLLCQVLAEMFRDSLEVIFLPSGCLSTPLALLQAIMHSLKLDYSRRDEGELRLALADHLGRKEAGRRLLLVVDDAESTPPRLLLELRNLTNLAREGKPLVSLVLAGSPELEEVFAGPKLESFNQRLAARCYLEALAHAETCQYVRAQLEAAGGKSNQLVTTAALDAVHRATGGIPRLINQLCDHALLMARSDRAGALGAAEIERAWADLQQLPTPWQPAQSSTSEPLVAKRATDSSVIEFGGLDEPNANLEPYELESVNEDEGYPEMAMPTVPFTIPVKPRLAAADLEAKFAAVESHLANVDAEFGAIDAADSAGHLIVAPSTDPFGEVFEEEEIVLDHFASLQSSAAQIHRRVHCYESQGLANALRGAASAATKVNALDTQVVQPHNAFDAVQPDVEFVKDGAPTVILDARTRAKLESRVDVRKIPPEVIRPEDFFASIDEVAPVDRELIVIDDEPLTGADFRARPPLRLAEFGRLFSSLQRD